MAESKWSWKHRVVQLIKTSDRALRTKEIIEHFEQVEKERCCGGNVRTALSQLKMGNIVSAIKVGLTTYYVNPSWTENGKIKEEYKPKIAEETFNQYWGDK